MQKTQSASWFQNRSGVNLMTPPLHIPFLKHKERKEEVLEYLEEDNNGKQM